VTLFAPAEQVRSPYLWGDARRVALPSIIRPGAQALDRRVDVVPRLYR